LLPAKLAVSLNKFVAYLSAFSEKDFASAPQMAKVLSLTETQKYSLGFSALVLNCLGRGAIAGDAAVLAFEGLLAWHRWWVNSPYRARLTWLW